MSERLQKNIKVLCAIAANRNPKSRKLQLKHICEDTDIASCLREICKNLVNNKIPLKAKHVKQLRKHKRIIREIAKKKNSKQKKSQLVQQSGGFLPILLPIVSTLLSLIK